MVCVKKKKMMCICGETTSTLRYYTPNSGRHKRCSGRSISKAVPHFRNLCVYKPNALRNKPSDLQCRCATKEHLAKRSEGQCHLFLKFFFMLYIVVPSHEAMHNSDDKCNSHTLTPHTHILHISPPTHIHAQLTSPYTHTHMHTIHSPPYTHTHSHICTNSHIHFSQLADDGDTYNSLPTHVPTNTTTQNSHTTSLIISSQWSEPPS